MNVYKAGKHRTFNGVVQGKRELEQRPFYAIMSRIKISKEDVKC